MRCDWRVFLGTLALGCGCARTPDVPERPYDIVLVSLDSVRRDAVSAFARPGALGALRRAESSTPTPVTTPHLDRLAREGVRFTRAYASSSWTLPAHVTLFAGAPEVVHGVDLENHRASPRVALLAEVLADAGYRTNGFFSGPYLDPSFGFGRGFEEYRRCYGDELERVVATGGSEAEIEVYSHGDVSAARVTNAGIEALERTATDARPLFLFLHYFDPHYDYIPPAPFDERFDPDYAGSVGGRNYLSNPAVSVLDPKRAGERVRVVGDRDLDHLAALYRGEVAWTDSQLGRLFEALERRSPGRPTLVWVVGDHGDEFFEHGGLGHRRTLFEEVLGIPMIAWLPGVLPAGSEVSAPVSLADVAPTLFEAIGLSGAERPGIFDELVGAAPESERGVMGRLVRTNYATVRVGELSLEGERVEVLESWTEGARKILRRRSWPRLPDGIPAGFEEHWAATLESERAREVITWVDLARDPGEPDAAWSEDFSGAGIQSALLRFRAAYRGFLERRREPASGSERGAVASELASLGYAAWSVEAEQLVLPLPGERVVTPARR